MYEGGRSAASGRRRATRAEEGAQDRGLEQLDLPAEGVPAAADLDDREVEEPEGEDEERVLAAGQEQARENEADEADGPQRRVGGAPVEERGAGEEVLDRRERGDAVGADERDELGDRSGEGCDAHEAEDAEDDEAREDVVALATVAGDEAMQPRQAALGRGAQVGLGVHRGGG